MIKAQLRGDDTAEACGLTIRNSSPVLALCRRLIEAGHDPSTRLEAYRGDVLCLSIRSIGEAANLTVSPHSVGFVRLPERRIAPPKRPPDKPGPDPSPRPSDPPPTPIPPPSTIRPSIGLTVSSSLAA
jgi:hypothetical protein